MRENKKIIVNARKRKFLSYNNGKYNFNETINRAKLMFSLLEG